LLKDGRKKTPMTQIDSKIYLGLKASLEKEGMVFGLDPTSADHLLGKRIGRKRYQKFCRLMDGVRDGSRPIAEAYRMFPNVLDANSLMSAQSDLMLAVNSAVIEVSGLLKEPYRRVGEIGCFSGGVIRYLARELPDTMLFGFDNLPRLLKCGQAISPANVRLIVWDYEVDSEPKGCSCEILYGSLAIDFDSSRNTNYPVLDNCEPTEEESIRVETENYATKFAKASQNWRKLVSTGAVLVIALRIPNVFTFSGIIQAAVITGWEPLVERWVIVTVADERLSLLVFRSADVGRLDAGALRSLTRRWSECPVWSV
jgi:SAM-dependent methyltransferase